MGTLSHSLMKMMLPSLLLSLAASALGLTSCVTWAPKVAAGMGTTACQKALSAPKHAMIPFLPPVLLLIWCVTWAQKVTAGMGTTACQKALCAPKHAMIPFLPPVLLLIWCVT